MATSYTSTEGERISKPKESTPQMQLEKLAKYIPQLKLYPLQEFKTKYAEVHIHLASNRAITQELEMTPTWHQIDTELRNKSDPDNKHKTNGCPIFALLL